eukprot:919417-Rhodomonas_salina.5
MRTPCRIWWCFATTYCHARPGPYARTDLFYDGVSCYAHATRSPVPTERMCYQHGGSPTETSPGPQIHRGIGLPYWAMPLLRNVRRYYTRFLCGAALVSCTEMPPYSAGTEIGYAGTRVCLTPMRCPVLRSAMLLPDSASGDSRARGVSCAQLPGQLT